MSRAKCVTCEYNEITRCAMNMDAEWMNKKTSRDCLNYSIAERINWSNKETSKNSITNTEQKEIEPRVRFHEDKNIKYFFYV